VLKFEHAIAERVPDSASQVLEHRRPRRVRLDDCDRSGDRPATDPDVRVGFGVLGQSQIDDLVWPHAR
jgi:hypothetical protein